jgi:hypothetical protein
MKTDETHEIAADLFFVAFRLEAFSALGDAADYTQHTRGNS